MADIPAAVLALAATVPQAGPLPPHPIAWRETPDGWVVVFEDGRKMRFPREATAAPIVTPAPTPAEAKAAKRRRY